MISVVIPLYNKQDSVAHTLECVLSQTYPDFEVVVVDDGSKDQSAAVVERFTDARIRLIKQKNGGVSAARNRGIEEAHGEFVAFLDADDEWHEDYLLIQSRLIDRYPDCVVFGCNYELHDENGSVIPTVLNGMRITGEIGVCGNYFDVASSSNPPLWTSAVIVRKEAIERIGGFPVGIPSGEDLITWARLAANFKICFNKQVLAYYNIRSTPSNKPPFDLTTTKDYVGVGLVELAKQFPNQRTSICKYINYWYGMRCKINIVYGTRIAALKCALKALRYYPGNFKTYIYISFIPLPKSFVKKVFKL